MKVLSFLKKSKLMEFGALGHHKVCAQLHVVQLDSNNSPEHVLVQPMVVKTVLVLFQRPDHVTELLVQVKTYL